MRQAAQLWMPRKLWTKEAGRPERRELTPFPNPKTTLQVQPKGHRISKTDPWTWHVQPKDHNLRDWPLNSACATQGIYKIYVISKVDPWILHVQPKGHIYNLKGWPLNSACATQGTYNLKGWPLNSVCATQGTYNLKGWPLNSACATQGTLYNLKG